MNILGITITRTKKLQEDWGALMVEQACIAAESALLRKLRDKKSEPRQIIARCARAEAKDFIEDYGENMIGGYVNTTAADVPE